jgi:hypothetical protein
MSCTKGRRNLTPLLLSVTLLAALTLIYLSHPGPRSTLAPLPLESWTVPDLADHLSQKGLSLHVISTGASSRLEASAYLTVEPKTRTDLAALTKQKENGHQWRGVVFCERPSNLDRCEGMIRDGGDCCLVVGSFVFFGDARLLVRIRAALQSSPPEKADPAPGDPS